MGTRARAGGGRATALTPGAASWLPPLHVLVGDRVAARDDLYDRALQLLELGAAIQLRLSGPDGPVYRLARSLVIGAEPGAAVFVNRRWSVALAAGARGVQLGRGSISPAEGRRLPGARALRVGVSVHDVGEVEAAAEGGADFLVAGTLYRTPSHPGREGAGAERIRRVIARLGEAGFDNPPVLGIGGVTAARISELCMAGAYGAVVDRAVWAAPDPPGSARDLMERIERC